MMFGIKVFSKVVSKIFFPWVPRDSEIFSGDLICHPEEVLFHSSRSLFFDCVICYGGGCAVVAMDWRGGLHVS
jgi:hypothetical protein